MDIKEKFEKLAAIVAMQSEIKRVCDAEEKEGALAYYQKSYEIVDFLGLNKVYEDCGEPVARLVFIKKTIELDNAMEAYQNDHDWPKYRGAVDAWFNFMISKLPAPETAPAPELCVSSW